MAKELNLSDLSDVTAESVAQMEGASYDAVIDSLARSQRNKVLQGIEKVKSEHSPQGPISLRGIGWVRATFGLTMLAIGWVIYAYGIFIKYVGEVLRKTAERILQQG